VVNTVECCAEVEQSKQRDALLIGRGEYMRHDTQ